MIFDVSQISKKRNMMFFWVAILLATASSLNAQQRNPKILLPDCSITLSDLEGGDHFLCESQNGDIRFEILSGNRANSGLMGDATPIFNNFWRNPGEIPGYSISLTPYREVPNIWKVKYLDGGGREIPTVFQYFIWSRNFSALGVGRNDFAIPYGPTRTIKCLNEHDESEPFKRCIAYYTALVCETWHNRYNQPVTVVSYPTIAVRSESYRASTLMMENYETIQRTAEKILNQVLNISCSN
ncbi:hypothetical protein [Rhodobacter sp. TJ_12]|uniref:hypothetical protein n=1 Tax=Rhodobacter sp. TJ_12 TaxID=2029399 RepID=UPI001CBC4126|nr:hypothetical protein [Rhodobacter sp. TJ_12]